MSPTTYPGFTAERLDDEHVLYRGYLPTSLHPDASGFQALWDLHPTEFHTIKMLGRSLPTPRWQQAYERDYSYTGGVNKAQPVPALIRPYLDWAQGTIDTRLNGLLLNWYDAALGHYIGKHRDSAIGLVPGSPIVTISLGASRLFRLRPLKGHGYLDYAATDGVVFVMPWETNRNWTHEVPKAAASGGRRLSITLRAFEDSSPR